MGMLSKCVMYATVSLSGEVDILADLRSILSMFRHSLLSLHMMIACTQLHRRLETERKIRTHKAFSANERPEEGDGAGGWRGDRWWQSDGSITF